jgi:hypothetical protein
MLRKPKRTVFGIVATFLIAIAAVPTALAQTKGKIPASNVSIDATSRTVTTSNFAITWNSGVDTEAVTSLIWKGGSNLRVRLVWTRAAAVFPAASHTSVIATRHQIRNREAWYWSEVARSPRREQLRG